MANKKICEISLLALQMFPASPVGTASVPRFAHKCRVLWSAKKTCGAIYLAPILLALHRSQRFTYYSRNHLVVLTGNGNGNKVNQDEI
jgi:hypothetical protein